MSSMIEVFPFIEASYKSKISTTTLQKILRNFGLYKISTTRLIITTLRKFLRRTFSAQPLVRNTLGETLTSENYPKPKLVQLPYEKSLDKDLPDILNLFLFNQSSGNSPGQTQTPPLFSGNSLRFTLASKKYSQPESSKLPFGNFLRRIMDNENYSRPRLALQPSGKSLGNNVAINNLTKARFYTLYYNKLDRNTFTSTLFYNYMSFDWARCCPILVEGFNQSRLIFLNIPLVDNSLSTEGISLLVSNLILTSPLWLRIIFAAKSFPKDFP
ncbi:hypothetical protein H8356DRAFT_1359077 [Neocallimastix lanati (nom. inval.)]|nr:hypothetical protein H8356DRAFT_1359077 [Neocallimastix sp. JGI-2020a]